MPREEHLPSPQPCSPLPVGITHPKAQGAHSMPTLSPGPSHLAGPQQAHLGNISYGTTCSHLLWLRNDVLQEGRDRANICAHVTASIRVCVCTRACARATVDRLACVYLLHERAYRKDQ